VKWRIEIRRAEIAKVVLEEVSDFSRWSK